ncbi:MAG: FKBP-type peptidyl-prolyl cis-trans isomerase N-terminal domain-containing protein, partial [Gammaproteobacteria bacterium]
MLKHIPVVLGCIGLLGCFDSQEDPSLNSQKDKASYSIGINLGTQLSQNKDDINVDKVFMGMKEAFAGKEPRLTPEEIRTVMTEFQQSMQKKQQDKFKTISEQNKKDGDAFLAKNKSVEGVKTLESGLQYQIITEGTGESPKVTDTVVTNYKGTLVNGQEFDSSYKRGQPATFPVNGVIAGWTEALQKMKVG